MEQIMICQILQYLDENNFQYEFVGNQQQIVIGYSGMSSYKEETMTWATNTDIAKYYSDNLQYKLVFSSNRLEESGIENLLVIVDERKAFFLSLENFFGEKTKIKERGKYCCISQSAKIHDSVSIGNNCTIMDNVTIGEGTILQNNIVIQSGVQIGKDCNVGSSVVIGEDGYNYVNDEIPKHLKHFGNVLIGDRVDIGMCSCIARGDLNDTIIEDNVKIGNACTIGHAVVIHKGAWIYTGARIAGNVEIGCNAKVCYGSVVKNRVDMASGSKLGIGAVLTRSILKEGDTWTGVPAKPIRQLKW